MANLRQTISEKHRKNTPVQLAYIQQLAGFLYMRDWGVLYYLGADPAFEPDNHESENRWIAGN